MAVWKNLHGQVVPKRGFGDTHGPSFPKVASICNKYGRVAFGGPDDHGLVYLVVHASMQSVRW